MKRLRYKLTLVVFLAITGVFVAVALILYGALSYHNTRQADAMTQLISISGGIVPEFQDYKSENYNEDITNPLLFNEESQFRTRYFIIYFGENTQVLQVNTDHIAAVNESAALDLADTAIAAGQETGDLEQFRYRVVEGEDSTAVIFLDCTESYNTRSMVMELVIGIALVIILLVTLLFGFFSRYAVRPFEENARRQKQFITNASHELKTPLAIISANAEVLQYKGGANQWTENITTQVGRMGKLIGDLLTLSKMDEMESDIPEVSVDLSALVTETATAFQEMADQKQIAYHAQIQPGIWVKGKEEQLRQMISVLVENAVKYVSPGGEIKIDLRRCGRHGILTLYNTAQLPADLDCDRLFDRFYRPDSARSSETGGHGIGLSIAQKTARQHGGRVQAQRQDEGICFTVSLPTRSKITRGKRQDSMRNAECEMRN